MEQAQARLTAVANVVGDPNEPGEQRARGTHEAAVVRVGEEQGQRLGPRPPRLRPKQTPAYRREMTSQAERDARVAEAAEALLADPMKRSLYGELLSAVRSRQSATGTPATLPPAAAPPSAPTVTSSFRATGPKRHRDPDFLAMKQRRLREEHVAPLQALVDEIRQERDTVSVPYVDPDSGRCRRAGPLHP